MTVAVPSRADEARAVPDRRPLGALLGANLISITGNALAGIGVPWFVLQTTGSASRAGLVAFCQMLPLAVSALAGGPVIDRIGRLRASVLSDLVCGTAIGLIPLLQWAGSLRFWQLCVLMAVNGLFQAPGETARQVLTPDLADHAGVPLARAMSLYTSASRGARLLGASAAGILIALFGAGPVLLLDTATFGVSALLVALGVRHVPAAAPRRDGAPASLRGYRAELREGLAFLLRQRLLLGITLVLMVTNGLDQGWRSVLLPVHAERDLGGSVDLGLLAGLFAAGALAGSLLHGALGTRLPRWPLYAGCLLVSGGPRMLVAAFAPGLLSLGITLAVAGVASGILNTIVSTVLYERVPGTLRSRVTGVLAAGVLLATPLGGLACGYLVDRVGLTAALVALGGVYLLITLCPLAFPSWRRMDSTGEA
ncbi:MFS transporter [Kitasatospora sp. DSM 101779]|uniref:MFS transporter n=1 Tax=Kitasatospora sp. DSM 101779 TaxID=2853165 RepID=UPI0021DA1748|nr:MFS transporter [Kitasatospora sp. DSM 101779]MCU7826885.1 MFS transporter [Kitasatospora sp. DSM 101779]